MRSRRACPVARRGPFAIAFATLLIAGYLVVPAAVVFGIVD